MAYYSAQSMYNPSVQPDTQGISRGILGASSAISGALGTYAGWKRDDAVRADQQQFASQENGARMDHESGMIDKRMGRDIQMFGMQQDAQKQQREIEKAMADEQLQLANTGKAAFLELAGYNPQALEAAGKMSPKAAAEFLDSAHAQAGLELRNRMEMEQAMAKAGEARKRYPLLDEATGKAEPGYFMTGNGQLGRSVGSGPQPLDQEIVQGMARIGMKPSSATIGGVKFEAPKTGAKTDAVEVPALDENGNWTGKTWKLPEGFIQDPATGKPVYVGGSASLIQRELQARQRNASGGTRGRLQDLNTRLQGLQ